MTVEKFRQDISQLGSHTTGEEFQRRAEALLAPYAPETHIDSEPELAEGIWRLLSAFPLVQKTLSNASMSVGSCRQADAQAEACSDSIHTSGTEQDFTPIEPESEEKQAVAPANPVQVMPTPELEPIAALLCR